MAEFTTYKAKKLIAQCSNCNNTWNPYNDAGLIVLPHEAIVICPQCGNKEEIVWGDSDFKRKHIESKLGSPSEKKLLEKISELENKFAIMEKEIDLLKQKQTLSDINVENVKKWANNREKDFLDIEMFAEEERQREKMQKDGI